MAGTIWQYAFDATRELYRLRRHRIVRRARLSSASWNYPGILRLLRAQEGASWRSVYDAYLDSEDWRARRRRHWRSTCEFCRAAAAVDMHHLTYARVGNERASDLAAVCRNCHERAHGRQPQERQNGR